MRPGLRVRAGVGGDRGEVSLRTEDVGIRRPEGKVERFVNWRDQGARDVDTLREECVEHAIGHLLRSAGLLIVRLERRVESEHSRVRVVLKDTNEN